MCGGRQSGKTGIHLRTHVYTHTYAHARTRTDTHTPIGTTLKKSIKKLPGNQKKQSSEVKMFSLIEHMSVCVTCAYVRNKIFYG